MAHEQELKQIIRQLYDLSDKLEQMYPGRHFTPDGHMVGSLGEAVASERYGLELFIASSPVHDGKAPDGRQVQIKTTQGNKIGISENPDFLIVLKMGEDGSFEEVYNGPGVQVWNACGPIQKTGQRSITLAKLRALNAEVPDGKRIPEQIKRPSV